MKKDKNIKSEPVHNGYEETELVEIVSTFSQATGIQLGKELTKWVAIGSFMGASDAIPGYCGATSLALLGVFKRLVLLTKSIFVPEAGLTRTKAFIFMLPFAIGWIIGVYGIAKGTEFLADRRNLGLELLFFFSTFVLFSIPMFLRGEKPDIGIKPKKRKNLWIRRFVFVLGIALILGLALYIKLGSQKGIHFGDHIDKNINGPNPTNNIWHPNVKNVFMLMGVAFLGGIFTITPGGSGAIIQLLFKGDEHGYQMYQTIHWKIMANFYGGHGTNFLGLFIFASFTMLGMLTMVFLFAWLFKRHKRTFAAMAFGMMLASAISLLVIPHNNLWNNLSSNSSKNYIGHRIGIVIAVILGAICSTGLNALTRHKEKTRKLKLEGEETITIRTSFWLWIKSLFTMFYWKNIFSNISNKIHSVFTKEYWEEVRLSHRKNAHISIEKDTIKERNANGEK